MDCCRAFCCRVLLVAARADHRDTSWTLVCRNAKTAARLLLAACIGVRAPPGDVMEHLQAFEHGGVGCLFWMDRNGVRDQRASVHFPSAHEPVSARGTLDAALPAGIRVRADGHPIPSARC